MKKLSLALLAMATALAITPSAMGDTVVALSATPAFVNATSVTSPLGTVRAAVHSSEQQNLVATRDRTSRGGRKEWPAR
jgi:hypothetical protein